MTDWNFDMASAPRDGRQVWVLFEDGHADARYWIHRKNGWAKNVGFPVAVNYRLARAVAFYLLPTPPEEVK